MEMFSISALDLFASALGTFILLAILLFPFYLRQPSLEAELHGARAELAASGESLREAERTAETHGPAQRAGDAALAEARGRLQQARGCGRRAAARISSRSSRPAPRAAAVGRAAGSRSRSTTSTSCS